MSERDGGGEIRRVQMQQLGGRVNVGSGGVVKVDRMFGAGLAHAR